MTRFSTKQRNEYVEVEPIVFIPIGDDIAPSDLEDEDEVDTETEARIPFTPTLDSGQDLESGARPVGYSTRGARDVVVSGPLRNGFGPGRWQPNRNAAHEYCVEKYGADRVVLTRQTDGRWAFLIKNLRTA